MSKLAIYTMIICQTIVMANATETTAQHKFLREISVELESKVGERNLLDLVTEIESKSDFHFAYSKAAMRKLSVELDGGQWNMDELMMELSKQLQLSIRRVNSTISLMPVSDDTELPAINEEFEVQLSVSGKVTDENGEGLPGASILEKGTTNGTITDVEGNFSLNVNEGATLTVSFVGYETKEIALNGRSVVDVSLATDISSLDEIVVVGYGTQKKSDLTGAVSSVSAEVLEAYPTFNTSQALKGRATGVEVKQNSGNPSSRIEVRIRGANSMIGSNDPLYVVDGVPLLGGIDFISPADIKSMDILKDASATAIYGARGANGVVIITTKSGSRSQKGTINIDSYYGVQNEVNRYEVLNAKEYATVVNEWMRNEGQPDFFDLSQIQDSGTDWQDAIFRQAPVQNHSISFTGGNNKTNYFVSGNFYSQDGIIKNTSARRGTLKFGLDHDINKVVSISENIVVSRRDTYNTPVDNGSFGKTTLSGALSAPPTLPIYDEEGIPTRIETAYFFGSVDMMNPVVFLKPRKSRDITDKILTNTTLSFQLLDGLKFKSMVGIEFAHGINENFRPSIFPNDLGGASEGYDYQQSFVNENTLNYSKNFGQDHALNLLGGFTYQSFQGRGGNTSVEGLASNITENYSLASASIVNTPTNFFSEWTLISWLGRANYSIKDRYLFTASIRADGSSRFGANNKWAVFPSAALGWKVSEEPFMQNVSQIDLLKLRASYGLSGNTALSPYQSLASLSSTKYIEVDDQEEVGWAPNELGNTDLKWETTSQFDIGLDLGIFQGAILLTLDYYKKITSDLLASVPLPPSLGYSSTLQNLGKIQNQGLEFSINAEVLSDDFSWNVIANISGNRNEVLELSRESDIYSGNIDIPFYSSTNIISVGQPFGMFFGYEEDGLDENGYIQYKDTDNSGGITAEDRVIIGNPYPDFIFSITNDFSYKNFDLSIFVDASQGNDLFWATAGTHLNSFQRGHNQFKDLVGNYWTVENPDPNAKYPVISSQSTFTVSDRFIEDGSYLRLKAITLGYNLPTENISWMSRARIYLTGSNLLTFTNYPGLDPESNTVGSDAQDAGLRSRIGIDQGAYPSARSFLIGINLSF